MSSPTFLKKAPWAALIAAAIVVLVDRRLLEERELWKAVRDRLEELPEPVVRLEIGKTKDILQLANLREAPPEMRRLIVLGNSRARVGLNLRDLPAENIQLAKVAHAAVSPYVMRTFAREAASYSPDLVVILISELDTHRPVELVPAACFASAPSLLQLLLSQPSIAWEQRQKVESVAVGTFLDSYLLGDIIDRAYLNDFREILIQKAERKPKRQQGNRRRPVPRKQLLIEAEDTRFHLPRIVEPDQDPPPLENIEEIRAEIARAFKRKKIQNSTLNIAYAISMGPHVATQMGLIEKTIEILHAAGSQVLIVEGPLNPVAQLLYDQETTRNDFLAFVERMKATYDVRFQSIEETGPYTTKDFSDVMHMKGTSARKLSDKVRKRVIELLDE